MKKVGVVTLYGMKNYGNRLQNYAVHRLLEQYGFEPESLVCEPSPLLWRFKVIGKYGMALLGKNKYIRFRNFHRFSRTYMKTRHIFCRNGLLQRKASKRYEYIVTGSDQVWNPEVVKEDAPNFFLLFAERWKRICLAPSIGISEIDPKDRYNMKKGLFGFRYLSVREEAGKKVIQELTGREAEVLIDPVMALDEQVWHQLAQNGRAVCKEPYLLCCFLEPLTEKRRQNIVQFANHLSLKVEELYNPQKNDADEGPETFLKLIEGAALVCTDSFHAAVFSILFHIPFYVFERESKVECANHISSRMDTLLSTFGLNDRCEQNMKTESVFSCNFVFADKKLVYERERFHRYLAKNLKQQNGKSHISLNLCEEDCTGCGACANKCPSGCITMEETEDGFRYPFVKEEGCAGCGECVTVCPVRKPLTGTGRSCQAYAVIHQDPEVLKNSSSGGMFYECAKQILAQNGVVYGAAFNNTFDVVHIGVENKSGIDALMRSKYVQSDTGQTFAEAKGHLDNGRLVLYAGTPCQIAGLKQYLGKDYQNLYTLDMVCHGVPSPKVWRNYKCELSRDRKITDISFRDKRNGWENHSLRITFSDGISYFNDKGRDSYFRAFSKNLFLRNSCYRCRFKGLLRESDMTLADFWGVQDWMPGFYSPNGVSMVICQSEKGRKLLTLCANEYRMMGFTLDTTIQKKNGAITSSVQKPSEREHFFRAYEAEPSIQTINEMVAAVKKKPFVLRGIGKIRRMIKRSKNG